ncbi:hypothetical protein M501DRAFT_930468 [Patellaria atrata CBS 101060]|uniref:SPX domain-containing protein n=1 Tax=Patellaria atrata CBS 101060 TaxID=1346257 RepID=A0A9P4SDV4_9PEZI|nr:hypothetical protein M501DRAFT_930468 [Patellaria atrata CBS 101060]
MKYGETLRQRSIPAWGHYNIDYDEIKHLIKQHTSPGGGKAVSIPGSGSTIEHEFESQLYKVLVDQHQRIQLFVRSKAGEIDRRLGHLQKQLVQIQSRVPIHIQGRITAKRLERYSKLEKDVLKVGEEIRSLSRFIGAQKIGFVKLLKKYKRWTGSDLLALRFNDEVLNKPTSFTNLDLGDTLDQWTDLLHTVRAAFKTTVYAVVDDSSSTIASDLASVVEGGSDIDFDIALATTPLGSSGNKAIYWIHEDNVLELHVLLLQFMRLLVIKNGSNSTSPSSSRALTRTNSVISMDKEFDSGELILDDLEKFVQRQSGNTISGLETTPGVLPVQASGIARWTANGEALVTVGSMLNSTPIRREQERRARSKRKHLPNCLDLQQPFLSRTPSERSSSGGDTGKNEDMEKKSMEEVREWLSSHSSVTALAGICSSRARFVGLGNNKTHGIWAVLDKDIVMKRHILSDLRKNEWTVAVRQDAVRFPHAVLEVRKEGPLQLELIKALDQSHLTERVRGFSLATHAVWACCHPPLMPQPFWVHQLSKDIRKLPSSSKHQRKGTSTVTFASSTSSSQTTPSTTSVTDGQSTSPGHAAVDSSATSVADLLEAPPLSVFRKKRENSYHSRRPLSNEYMSESEFGSTRYWSEYDHPEDGDEDGYYLYIDPNASSTWPGKDTVTRLWTKMRDFLVPKSSSSTNIMGNSHHRPLNISDDSESSTDESRPPSRSYGTLPTQTEPPERVGYFRSLPWRKQQAAARQRQLSAQADSALIELIESRAEEVDHTRSRVTTVSLLASATILTIVFVLASTGRNKQRGEVDFGIMIGVIASLLFALTGILYLLLRGRRASFWEQLLSTVIGVTICLADGALLTWIFV